jgi:hypothetical protein
MSVSPFFHKAFQDAAAPERLQRAERARLAAELRAASSERPAVTVTATARRRRAFRPVLGLLQRLG